MSDLISRKAITSRIESEYRKYGEEYDAGQILCDIEDFPTAFDLENVVEQLEKKRDYCYSEMEKERNETDYFSEHIFEEYHNQGKAFNEALEIIKSAANATNEKGEG